MRNVYKLSLKRFIASTLIVGTLIPGNFSSADSYDYREPQAIMSYSKDMEGKSFNLGEKSNFDHFIYQNGLEVAVTTLKYSDATFQTAVLTSTVGENKWHISSKIGERSSKMPESFKLRYLDGIYTLSSNYENEGGRKGYTSRDGIKWEVSQQDFADISTANGDYIAIDFMTEDYNEFIVRSKDLKNWKRVANISTSGAPVAISANDKSILVGDYEANDGAARPPEINVLDIASNKWTVVKGIKENVYSMIRNIYWTGSEFIVYGTSPDLSDISKSEYFFYTSPNGYTWNKLSKTDSHLIDIVKKARLKDSRFEEVFKELGLESKNLFKFETPIRVMIDNKYITFDQDPINKDGSILVPLRTIFETLGANVKWEQETKKVSANKGDVKIEMIVGENKAIVNDKVVTLEASSRIINGKTLVPVRFISEAFGSKVSWDAKNKTVIID